jgi:hypothetical protein
MIVIDECISSDILSVDIDFRVNKQEFETVNQSRRSLTESTRLEQLQQLIVRKAAISPQIESSNNHSTTETSPPVSDSDEDELTRSPGLFEREHQLIVRNPAVEARIVALLKSASIEDLPPSQTPKPGQPGRSKRSSTAGSPVAPLPAARASSIKPGIIEVELPRNVEAVPDARFDRGPELRQAFHKIAEEIVAVQLRF